MMWFNRFYEKNKQSLIKGKVNLLYGPRRVGKTALIEKLVSEKKTRYLLVTVMIFNSEIY